MQALAVGVVASLGLSVPAGAAPAPDPQTTNVPYTAWRGEQLRLVKCSEDLIGIDSAGLAVAVEEWSGSDNTRPTVFAPSITKIGGTDGECARVNVVSTGAGLARIKLKAFQPSDRAEILEHQFLAIWMSLATPAIDEVGADDPTGGPAGSASEVGDPAGDGSFVPSSRNGRVQVTVKGTFPVDGGDVTLPDDWAALAQQYATSSDSSDDNPAMRWDIHDDMLKTEGHVMSGPCTTETADTAVDAVDNCNGGEAFSRIWDDLVGGAGPFDPLRRDTLLSDGKLDAGDAPMPAARIDFAIAPNTSGGINGAGALEPASKREVYSRNGNGDDSAHNLYAPYYTQWIPAASAESVNPAASGTDGYRANNFNGFLTFGPYDNWDTFSLTALAARETDCNRTVAFPGGYEGDSPRTTPEGDQRVAVYTDEHGEAQVEFNPYAGGFHYDAVGAILNDNRGCDLQGIGTLGTASITATAKYPSQPVSDGPKVSDPVVKTIGNEFDKSITYYPKGAGDANANARIVVAHGQDVDGTPFAGERVCFYVDGKADSYRLFQGVTGQPGARFRVSGDLARTPSIVDPRVRCAYLDENGNAAIEVFNSDPESVNVIGEYVDEGLLRDRDVEFGTPGSGDPNPPTNTPPVSGPPVTAPATGPGTTAPSVQQIIQTAGASADHLLGGAKVGKASRGARVTSARVVRVKSGRYLVVKVKSSSKTAKLAIRMKMRSGKSRTVTRTVKANKSVRVMRISSAVKSVKVTLAS